MAEPRQSRITIPGYRQGFNCRLSVPGYGRTAVRTMELLYGVNIIPGSDVNEAGNRRVFYPLVTTSSSFGMVIVHTSRRDRNQFNEWLRGYMRAVTGNRRINASMKIEVPARRFVRRGICSGTLHYGESIGDLDSGSTGQYGQDDPDTGRGFFQTVLDFVGASDPISALGRRTVPAASYFIGPGGRKAQHFFPAATQVSGRESLEGTIFDSTPEEVLTEADIRADYSAGRASGLIDGHVSYDNYRNLVRG